MTDKVKYTSLTPITSDSQLRRAVNDIIANLAPLTGQHRERANQAVTWLDLINAGYQYDFDGDGGFVLPPVVGPEEPDTSTPPAVVGFTAAASFNYVTMSWEQPRYKNHSHVEIWRAEGFKTVGQGPNVPTVLGDAVFRIMSPSIVASDTVLPGDVWRYWARNVSSSGVVGPWTSVDGLLVAVPESPAYLIDKISGEIREGDLYPALGDKINFTYNGVNEHTAELIAHQTELQKHTTELQQHTTELQSHADSLLQHGTVLAQHSNSISANGAAISQQSVIVADHASLLSQHTTQIAQSGNSITEQGRILTTHESTLVSHGRTLATQNAAISDLRTITETQGETLLSHSQSLITQGSSINELKTVTQTHDSLLLQHSQSLATQGGGINELKTVTQTHDSLLLQHTNQISTANANIISISQIVDSQGKTLAEHTQTLSSHGTAIQQQASINTAQGALINAAWTVRIDSGNAVSGFGLMVDGATGRSDFIVRADRFAIAAPQAYDQNGKPVVDTNAFPFIVDVTNPAAPKTLIKSAYIDQAFIQNLVTGSLVADRITGQTLTGTHIRGGDMVIGSNFNVDGAGSATMLNAFIKGTMQSNNYAAGSAGWQVRNDGYAEFRQAVVRGTIYADAGYFNGTVYAEKMVGGAYTKRNYSGQYHADNMDTSWRTALRITVARAMAVVRKLEIFGTAGHFSITAKVEGSGSGTLSRTTRGTFEVRIVRDGVVVEAQQQKGYSVTASSNPSSGPQSNTLTGGLDVSLIANVPSDSATHFYDLQFRLVYIGGDGGGTGSAGCNSADGSTAVMYIENGDLA